MEKFWVKNYHKGVPAEINPDQYTSIAQLLHRSCVQYGDKTAFSNFGTRLTYKQLEEKSTYFAAYLQQVLCLKKGDRIAIMIPNLLQYPIALYAAQKIGLTVVNTNPFYTDRELALQLQNCGAETIIVFNRFVHTVITAAEHTALKNIITTQIGDLLDFPKAQMMNLYVHLRQKKVDIPEQFEISEFKQALEIGKTLKVEPVFIHQDDVAFIQYTGGTTGTPKGAMLTQRNIVAQLEQTSAWMAPTLSIGNEVVITALPLYHVFALVANCLLFIKAGGHDVLITDPRQLNHFVGELSKINFTIIIAVETLFKRLLKHQKFLSLNFSSLKYALCGGSPLSEQTVNKWERLTGKSLLQGYGLTEASPVVAIEPMDRRKFTGSVGFAIPSTDIQIINESEQPCKLGEEGELWVKGPQVMKGYWQCEEETRKIITESGWLKTGDIARMDHHGYIYILDRIKDLILVSGFNVYPSEIEEVIDAHPQVARSGVIGIQSEKTGEAVKAFIVKNDPDLTRKDIITHCRQFLTTYKIPQEIEFVEELPMSMIGKTLRRHLRDR